jgi:hypothetical protein
MCVFPKAAGIPPMPEIVADLPKAVLLPPVFHKWNQEISIAWC